MSTNRHTAVFADLSLARRLERSEGLACAESAQARAIVFPDSGAESQEIGGTNVVFDGVNSPITQTFGLGMLEAVDDALLDRIEEFFKRRAAPVYHEVCPLADPSLLPLLHRRGYQPFEYSSVMFRSLSDDLVNTLSESNGLTARTILAGACTVPRWRGQGAQRALLSHRLRYGAEHGCDLAMIVAAPGSASQRNAEREGFRIAYTRLKWRLPTTIS